MYIAGILGSRVGSRASVLSAAVRKKLIFSILRCLSAKYSSSWPPVSPLKERCWLEALQDEKVCL